MMDQYSHAPDLTTVNSRHAPLSMTLKKQSLVHGERVDEGGRG